MTDEEYRRHPFISNSLLKENYNKKYPQSFDITYEDAFRFGLIYDARTTKSFFDYSKILTDTGKPGEQQIVEDMYGCLVMDSFCSDVLINFEKQVPCFNEDVKLEHNGYKFSVAGKCLFDFHNSVFGGDLKTFSGSSIAGFMMAARRFGWIESRAYYMKVANTKKDFIIAQSKKKPYPIFKLFIREGDELYKEGLAGISEKAFIYHFLS